MTVNPGLRSRFSQKIFFPDFNCEDACQLLKLQLRREYELALSPDAATLLPGLMQRVSGWGARRDLICLIGAQAANGPMHGSAKSTPGWRVDAHSSHLLSYL